MIPEDQKEKTAPSANFEAGEIFDSKFDLVQILGSGAFGIVYKAVHLTDDRTVALKVLHPHLVDDESSKKRFQREAKSLSGLNHPNLATVYDAGFMDSGQPYIAMELISGRSLSDYIVQHGPLTAEEAISIFAQICDALAAANAREVLHRDLTPGNIFLCPTESGGTTVKILDFGLVRPMGRWGYDTLQLTKAGETVGTPPYMSPEQCAGDELDGRSDIYSLGCVLYEALSGERPFEGTVLECMQKQLYEFPPPIQIKSADPQTAIALQRVLTKAIEKKQRDRYQSMKHMRADMLSCLPGGARAPLAQCDEERRAADRISFAARRKQKMNKQSSQPRKDQSSPGGLGQKLAAFFRALFR